MQVCYGFGGDCKMCTSIDLQGTSGSQQGCDMSSTPACSGCKYEATEDNSAGNSLPIISFMTHHQRAVKSSQRPSQTEIQPASIHSRAPQALKSIAAKHNPPISANWTLAELRKGKKAAPDRQTSNMHKQSGCLPIAEYKTSMPAHSCTINFQPTQGMMSGLGASLAMWLPAELRVTTAAKQCVSLQRRGAG